MLVSTFNPHVLLQAEGDPQGSGGVSDQAASAGGNDRVSDGGKSEGDKSDGEGGERGDKAPVLPKDQPITPATLKGVLDFQERTARENLGKSIGQLEKSFDKRFQAMEKLLSQGEKKARAKPDEPSPELAEMKREIDELRQEKQKVADALAESQRKDRQYRFETEVKAALSRHGCRKPEEAYYVLAPRLTHDEDNSRIYAVVEGDYGREELELDAYIKREVKENIIPEFFRGVVRAGSAAGGDAGGGGQYKFTKEQIFGPDSAAFYAENAEEIRKALEEGKVKGVPRPAP